MSAEDYSVVTPSHELEGKVVRIGNSHQHFRVTEVVAEDALGRRYVSAHALDSREVRTGVSLAEILVVG